MKTLTERQVRTAVKDTAREIIDHFTGEPETDREQVIDRMDEAVDELYGGLVMQGRIAEYTVDDLVKTADSCAAIVHVAQAENCVEDDSGLWDGLTYGVLAVIAFYSLKNLVSLSLVAQGVDTNDEQPFAVKADAD